MSFLLAEEDSGNMSAGWLHRPGPSRAAYALLLLLSQAGHTAWGLPTDPVVHQTPSIFSPHSGPAQTINHLSLFVMQITGAIFIVVGSLFVYVVVRFRQRDPQDDSEPPQIYGSTQIELAWTVIPVLIVLVLFLTTARVLFAIQDQKMPESALKVDVVGHQFWWEFHYGSEGFTTANELHVPLSTEQDPRTTSLNLLSADVDHSFWVPALFGKIDTMPNQVNHIWFTPDETGMYVGQCAQFCGVEHAKMLLRVYVQSPEDYAAWVKNQQQPGVQDPAVAQGRQLFESQACVSCHVIRGTSANGKFGPDLTHFASRDTLASGAAANTDANLKLWIQDPDYVKPGSLMPAMQLSNEQIDQISAYLETLK
ncbi:MAG: cytochrome c oxidase subunit II [Acidobacteriaceae bacterium]